MYKSTLLLKGGIFSHVTLYIELICLALSVKHCKKKKNLLSMI